MLLIRQATQRGPTASLEATDSKFLLNREWGTRIADVRHVLCHLVIALRLLGQLGEVDVGDVALAHHLLFHAGDDSPSRTARPNGMLGGN